MKLVSLVSVLPGLSAHRSAALWIPESRTALVADVHLGYSWAQRRRGELGPLADARARDKLLTVISELRPLQIVFLGDLVHAPRPCPPEREWIEGTLLAVGQTSAVIAVKGNHDRAFAREFGHLPVRVCEHWSDGRVIAVHGDRLAAAPVAENKTLVVGHLHPCLSVRDAAGATQKLPIFLVNRYCIVLPAFSPFARGYDVSCGLPDDLRACFQDEPINAYAVTNSRIVPLGPLARAMELMSEADRSAPSQFRRSRR